MAEPLNQTVAKVFFLTDRTQRDPSNLNSFQPGSNTNRFEAYIEDGVATNVFMINYRATTKGFPTTVFFPMEGRKMVQYVLSGETEPRSFYKVDCVVPPQVLQWNANGTSALPLDMTIIQSTGPTLLGAFDTLSALQLEHPASEKLYDDEAIAYVYGTGFGFYQVDFDGVSTYTWVLVEAPMNQINLVETSQYSVVGASIQKGNLPKPTASVSISDEYIRYIMSYIAGIAGGTIGITYDNTISGLIATTLKTALDELDGKVEQNKSDIATHETRLDQAENELVRLETDKVDKTTFDVAKMVLDGKILNLQSDKVDKTQTIAGVDLQDNITKEEMKVALDIDDLINANMIKSVVRTGTNLVTITYYDDTTDTVITLAELKAFIGEATQSLSGLMSAQDKTDIDTLMALFDSDGDSVVNTIQEILDIFQNYPGGANILEVLNDKVDKIEGKGLSENDYTDIDKNKVDNIDEIYTSAEKNKLSGIEAGAEINEVNSVNGKVGTVVINADEVPFNGSGTNYLVNKQNGESAVKELDTQVKTTAKEVKKHFMQPQFVEYFASFNRFGMGTPQGIANYTGGNYVLTVSGNAGESFVTVESGDVSDAGVDTRWACVIENNDGIFSMNQVTGTSGSQLNLLEPLKKNISSKRLGNLMDDPQGQHYTELGYFAYAQHLYFMNPRHVERESYIAQFKPDDTSGEWVSNAYLGYDLSVNMKPSENYFTKIGSKSAYVNAANNTHYVEWEQELDGKKGYFESYIGMSTGTLIIEFYKDGVLAETRTISTTVRRVVFDYENVEIAKIKIKATQSQVIYLGLTTWWTNDKVQDEKIISPNDKIVFMGDSWGTRVDYAVTRELERLMNLDGGTPTTLNHSKGGHTSTYARAWFDEYVINNNPDKVIIEYFTNDFNSIAGTVLSPFINPDGQEQDMNIASLSEYVSNIVYMINKAIENGIQPIIMMPASTDASSQTLRAANFAVQLWLGNSLIEENPKFKTVESEKTITALIETKQEVYNSPLVLLSKDKNSSARKGIVSESSNNLTGGYIHTFNNNGEQKAGVKHDGALDIPTAQLQPLEIHIGTVESTRGSLYLKSSSSGDDTLWLIIKLADGSYTRKQIKFVD